AALNASSPPAIYTLSLHDALPILRAEYPELRHVWYDDPRGLRNYAEPVLSSYDSLLEAGRARLQEDPGLFDREIAAGDPSDPARSEEHTSELQSRENLVCRLLLEK